MSEEIINPEVTTLAEAAHASTETPPEVSSEPEETHEETPEEVAASENKPSIKKLKEKLNRKVELARQDAIIAQEEVRFLREQVRTTQASQQVAPAPVQVDKPTMSQFNNMEQYTEALTDWKLAQRDAQYQKDLQIQAQQEKNRTYNTKVVDFAKTVPDFQEVLDEAANVRMDADGLIIQAIIESDVGPQLAYHLAKYPEEVARLNKLTPQRRLIELGKLEDKVSVKEQVAPRTIVHNAPTPVKPVAGNVSITTKSVYEMTPQELLKHRTELAKQGKIKR